MWYSQSSTHCLAQSCKYKWLSFNNHTEDHEQTKYLTVTMANLGHGPLPEPAWHQAATEIIFLNTQVYVLHSKGEPQSKRTMGAAVLCKKQKTNKQTNQQTNKPTNQQTNKQKQPQLALGRPFSIAFLFSLGPIVPSQLPHHLGSCPTPTSCHGLGLHLLCT